LASADTMPTPSLASVSVGNGADSARDVDIPAGTDQLYLDGSSGGSDDFCTGINAKTPPIKIIPIKILGINNLFMG